MREIEDGGKYLESSQYTGSESNMIRWDKAFSHTILCEAFRENQITVGGACSGVLKGWLT